jgi:hypothetical protein
MPRWARQAGQNDQMLGWSFPQPTGDTSFVGMDLKTRDPAQIMTGWYAEGYNVRLENGGMATRKGSLCPGGLNYAKYGQIYGVGIFSDPNGEEWLVLAVSSGVWFAKDNEAPRFVPMATLINYTVEFSQSFNNLYMWRGPTMTPLKWEGDWSVFWQELTDPGAYDTYTWNWNWITTAGPANGQVATNTNDWSSSVTTLDIAKTNSGNTDVSAQLLGFKVGDTIRFQNASDPTVWVQWLINTVGTDQGTFIRFAVGPNTASGTTPANNTALSVSFMTTSTADATRKAMPNAITAETFSNRMLVPHDRDGLAISDIGNDDYQWAVNDFRINQGEADTLVRVFPWVIDMVLCFKQHSIFQMANVTGDLSTTTLQKLPGTRGLVGLKALTAVSGDIYFLDYSGVYQITQVFEGSPQSGALPVSDNIKPLIDSINWTAAAGIRAENRRERVYFAVPLQNAVRNNVLLVYNTVSASWESIDTFGDPDFRIDDLVKTNYIGDRRLYAIDRQKGIVLLLEQGKTDLMGNTTDFEYQIDFGVLTRGYAGVGPRNDFPRVGIGVSTWNPSFSVEAYVDGSNAKTLVSDRTKNRVKYDLFGKPNWNQENLNDDHASARRKDYSVGLPLMLGYNGVQIERQQESTERFSVDMFGHYCQLRIENSVGAIGIRSIVLEDYEDQREPRTQV